MDTEEYKKYNLTLQDVCLLLNRSPKSVQRYIKKGYLSPIDFWNKNKIKKYRFSREDVLDCQSIIGEKIANGQEDRQGHQKTSPSVSSSDHHEKPKEEVAQETKQEQEEDKEDRQEDRHQKTGETPNERYISRLEKDIDYLKEQINKREDDLNKKDDQLKMEREERRYIMNQLFLKEAPREDVVSYSEMDDEDGGEDTPEETPEDIHETEENSENTSQKTMETEWTEPEKKEVESDEEVGESEEKNETIVMPPAEEKNPEETQKENESINDSTENEVGESQEKNPDKDNQEKETPKKGFFNWLKK